MEILNEVTLIIRYSRKDMGLKCTFMVKGKTLEEVTRQALDHVRENHANEFNRFNSPEEIEQMNRR